MDIFRLEEIRNKIRKSNQKEISFVTGLSHMTIYNVVNRKRVGLRTVEALLKYFWPETYGKQKKEEA